MLQLMDICGHVISPELSWWCPFCGFGRTHVLCPTAVSHGTALQPTLGPWSQVSTVGLSSSCNNCPSQDLSSPSILLSVPRPSPHFGFSVLYSGMVPHTIQRLPSSRALPGSLFLSALPSWSLGHWLSVASPDGLLSFDSSSVLRQRWCLRLQQSLSLAHLQVSNACFMQ